MTRKTILSWSSSQLQQTHNTTQTTLIVSGCSFTDSYGYTDYPRTWPGYLCERAGFKQVIDVSLGGAGNEYIATSIVNQIESMTAEEIKTCMVVVVWSGIDRKEDLETDNAIANKNNCIDNVVFKRVDQGNNDSCGEALRSWKNIIMLQNYLENKRIPFGFSHFINTFDPPFLPNRTGTHDVWGGILAPNKIQQLRTCNWIHDHRQSLFEYCFEHEYLASDLFHPTMHGYLSWTDQILLPGLTKMGLITQVDQ